MTPVAPRVFPTNPDLTFLTLFLLKEKGRGKARRFHIFEVLSSTDQFLKDHQYGERIGN